MTQSVHLIPLIFANLCQSVTFRFEPFFLALLFKCCLVKITPQCGCLGCYAGLCVQQNAWLDFLMPTRWASCSPYSWAFGVQTQNDRKEMGKHGRGFWEAVDFPINRLRCVWAGLWWGLLCPRITCRCWPICGPYTRLMVWKKPIIAMQQNQVTVERSPGQQGCL